MAPPSRRSTILLIEDDPAVREFYRTALSAELYRVVAVEDGLDALRWLEHDMPNVIVLDLSLIRMDGRDVQRAVRTRADTKHIPIVVVTGRDIPDVETNELTCVLKKPVTAERLVEAVAGCLRRVQR